MQHSCNFGAETQINIFIGDVHSRGRFSVNKKPPPVFLQKGDYDLLKDIFAE